MTTSTKKTSKKAALKKASAKKNAVKKVSVKKVAPKKKAAVKSKMDKAVAIVERMFPKYSAGEIERKAILKELTSKCDMSPAYAATAFQTIKNRILIDELN